MSEPTAVGSPWLRKVIKMQARNDIAFTRLCSLIEAATGDLHPDAVRYSGEREVYRHLLDIGALGPGDGISPGILCPWCEGAELAEIGFAHGQHRGYCSDCGWVDLGVDQVKPFRVDMARIVRWLSAALGLSGRYACEALVSDALWRLGEIEHRRKRRTVFFGRRLDDPACVPIIAEQLRRACAPGCGVLITTTPDVDGALLATGHPRSTGFSVSSKRPAGSLCTNASSPMNWTSQSTNARAPTSSNGTGTFIMHSSITTLQVITG
jgi:hypothetical protein